MATETAGARVPTPAQAIDFLTAIESLKVTKRTGWVNHGIRGPESIADHMYRMAVMSLLVMGDESVDWARCMQLAVVHDIAESLVGDITPHDGISDEEKHRRESDAIVALQAMLGGPLGGERRSGEPGEGREGGGGSGPEGDERGKDGREGRGGAPSSSPPPCVPALSSLWREYEAGSTPEARLVKDFDKLEMILQAHEYEQREPSKDLETFFAGCRGKWRTELGERWAAEVERRREEGIARTGDGTGEEGGGERGMKGAPR